MPVVESNKHWTVRLTTPDELDLGPKQFPDSYFGVYVDEVGAKGARHYHIAVSFNEPKTNKQVTAMLDKAFPTLTGNAKRQKKQWRTGHDLSEDQFIQYMFKTKTPSRWGDRDDWPGDEYFQEQCLLKQKEIAASVKFNKSAGKGKIPSDVMDVITRVKNKRGVLLAQPDSLLKDVIEEYFAYNEEAGRRLKGTHNIKTDIENIMFYTGNELFRRNWKRCLYDSILSNFEARNF